MDTDVMEYLLRICRDAGLSSAMGIFELLDDRDVLPRSVAMELSPEDVTEIYNEAVGPAVDRAESLLLRHQVGDDSGKTACGLTVTWHRTFADPDMVTCPVCKMPGYYDHRREMGKHLNALAGQLDAMYRYWVNEDLPSDFLLDAYPFDRSLDDLTSEVRAAADRLKEETDKTT